MIPWLAPGAPIRAVLLDNSILALYTLKMDTGNALSRSWAGMNRLAEKRAAAAA
jgi:hypothetical protein